MPFFLCRYNHVLMVRQVNRYGWPDKPSVKVLSATNLIRSRMVLPGASWTAFNTRSRNSKEGLAAMRSPGELKERKAYPRRSKFSSDETCCAGGAAKISGLASVQTTGMGENLMAGWRES